MDVLFVLIVIGLVALVFWRSVGWTTRLAKRLQDPRPEVRNRWPWERD